jgi:hypothetical protein
MSSWVVSYEALGKLADKLYEADASCEQLSYAFAFTPSEVVRGKDRNSIFELLNYVAKSASGFTQDHLDVIETRFVKGTTDNFFKELKVELDLGDPADPLLTPDEREQLERLAERASLLEERRLKAVRQKLNFKLKGQAASSEIPRDQWRLWLRACSRQDLPKDRVSSESWLGNLAHCAAGECEDENCKRTFEQVRDRCKSAPGQWNLIELLRAPPPLPVAEPPRHSVTAAPELTAPIELPAGAPKTGYALVIGISKYTPQGPGSLKCAANDAQQLAAYLQGQPDIDFSGERVRTLTDEDATLRGVLGGLEWLRVECASSEVPDPLAIVYFSGHGMPDVAGRHFLVPHDGDRQQLFATALWNRTFNAALEQIPTRRLVVLLDACHAGGMVELAGAKAGAALSYDPDDEREGLRLEPGHGRYYIASCASGQHSFEGGDNGIFTQSLLALLRFEELDAEKLDLADLYRELRKRVDDAARRLFGGRRQTPTGNIAEATASTGLILAINKRRANRMKIFLQTVRKYLQDNRFPQKTTIVVRLEDFVERNERPEPDDPEFFDLFTEGAERWLGPTDEACVKEVCGHLAKRMGAAKAAPGSQPVRGTSDFTAAPAPGLSASGVTAGSTPTLPTPSANVVPAPAAAARSPGAAIPMYQWRITPTGG